MKVVDDSQLTNILGKGEYDMFAWGWTPYADPDTMLDYMTCDQVSADPEDPTNYYNDANLCDKEYDRLYKQQKVELDPEKRREIVHEMLTRWQQTAVYNVLWEEPDTHRLRQGPLHRLDSTAREDRSGDLLQHLADLRAHQAGDRGGGGRRLR